MYVCRGKEGGHCACAIYSENKTSYLLYVTGVNHSPIVLQSWISSFNWRLCRRYINRKKTRSHMWCVDHSWRQQLFVKFFFFFFFATDLLTVSSYYALVRDKFHRKVKRQRLHCYPWAPLVDLYCGPFGKQRLKTISCWRLVDSWLFALRMLFMSLHTLACTWAGAGMFPLFILFVHQSPPSSSTSAQVSLKLELLLYDEVQMHCSREKRKSTDGAVCKSHEGGWDSTVYK